MQTEGVKPSKFGRGEMSDSHFNALVDATKLKSMPVISALYEHLVNGHRKVDSYQKHKVDMSLFSRRLASLKKMSETAERLSKYYQ